jgi:glycerate kinase
MAAMRVIIASDGIGSLTSARAGRILADAWSDRRARVETIPIGEAGAGFIQAVADAARVEPVAGVSDAGLTTVVDTPERLVVSVESTSQEQPRRIDRDASSYPIGAALADAVRSSRHRAPEVVLDVSANRAHDAGAGLLAALGATGSVPLEQGVAGLHGVSRVELDPVRDLLGGRRVTVVVPSGEEELPLLGLRGITSRFGREQGWHPEMLLATDASLQAFTLAAAPGLPESSDWGACGGLGFTAYALGGRVLTGPAYCAEIAGLAERLPGADLLVTGCSVFDFAERGGGVVASVAAAGTAGNVPVILVAGEVVVGSREMRTMGIESAYGVHESQLDRPTGAIDAEDLAETAGRVARSWSW